MPNRWWNQPGMMASGDKKLVRSKSGLRIVALNENITSPFLITEPQWVPDNECNVCMSCETKFDFLKRRHHCRRCGKCFCNTCCESKVALPRMCFIDPVRQCGTCLEVSRKENEFFDKSVKILQNGGMFITVLSPGGVDEVSATYTTKLSSDHRFLLFDETNNSSLELMPIELSCIEAARILTSGLESPGNRVATGLSLTYQDANQSIQEIQLLCPDTLQKRQSVAWLAAMQKAMKLLYEGRSSQDVLTPLLNFATQITDLS